jgi:hypothetical protein
MAPGVGVIAAQAIRHTGNGGGRGLAQGHNGGACYPIWPPMDYESHPMWLPMVARPRPEKTHSGGRWGGKN